VLIFWFVSISLRHEDTAQQIVAIYPQPLAHCTQLSYTVEHRSVLYLPPDSRHCLNVFCWRWGYYISYMMLSAQMYLGSPVASLIFPALAPNLWILTDRTFHHHLTMSFLDVPSAYFLLPRSLYFVTCLADQCWASHTFEHDWSGTCRDVFEDSIFEAKVRPLQGQGCQNMTKVSWSAKLVLSDLIHEYIT